MAKILEATCENSVVSYGSLAVQGVTILGEGIGASTGVLILDEDKAYYVPRTSPDLEAALNSITDALSKIADTLTAIGSGMTGPTTSPPPSLPGNVSQINGFVTDLTTLAGDLR